MERLLLAVALSCLVATGYGAPCTYTASISGVTLFIGFIGGDYSNSFLNCFPATDPNALEPVPVTFAVSSTTANGVFRISYVVSYSGGGGGAQCSFSPGNPCTTSAVGDSPSIPTLNHYTWIGARGFTGFNAVTVFTKVMCSTRCKGGFGAPATCGPTTERRCTQVCQPNEITVGRLCTPCPANSQPNAEKTACVDVDECAAGTATCPANSDCVNLDIFAEAIPYKCVCDVGYVVQGTESREGSSTSTCVLTPINIVIGQVIPTQVDFTLSAVAVTLFRAELFALDNANREFRIFSEKTSGAQVVDTLIPGTKYKIKAIVLDASEEDTNLVSFDTFVTPCTCSNQPLSPANGNGKPTNLTATQLNGQITFSFVDQSQCELAYSLSRKAVTDATSVVFAPDYYYTAETNCGEVYNPVSR